VYPNEICELFKTFFDISQSASIVLEKGLTTLFKGIFARQAFLNERFFAIFATVYLTKCFEILYSRKFVKRIFSPLSHLESLSNKNFSIQVQNSNIFNLSFIVEGGKICNLITLIFNLCSVLVLIVNRENLSRENVVIILLIFCS